MDAPVEIWGEDALLQWPGARRSLIQDRDAYMARTIWAAVTGAPVARPFDSFKFNKFIFRRSWFPGPSAAFTRVCLPPQNTAGHVHTCSVPEVGMPKVNA